MTASSVADAQFVTVWKAPPPSSVDATSAVAPAVAAPVDEGGVDRAGGPVAEFARFVLTQWIAAFITYEALAATIDRKGRYLPTLGL